MRSSSTVRRGRIAARAPWTLSPLTWSASIRLWCSRLPSVAVSSSHPGRRDGVAAPYPRAGRARDLVAERQQQPGQRAGGQLGRHHGRRRCRVAHQAVARRQQRVIRDRQHGQGSFWLITGTRSFHGEVPVGVVVPVVGQKQFGSCQARKHTPVQPVSFRAAGTNAFG